MTKLDSRHKHSAFTLIELLIVVAIIGILAAIAVPNFVNSQMRAKVVRSLADMNAVKTANEMYRLDNNAYMAGPAELGALIGSNFMGDRVRQQLTTPIAYMASFLYDPFVAIENPDNAGAAGRFIPLGLYHYRNVRGDRRYITGGDWHPDAEWLAKSPGPDRWHYPSPGCLYREMAYKPSNGLRSAGDIIVSNIGILGETYPGREGTP